MHHTREISTGALDSPPRHSASDTVIYETHVRRFTIHPSSGVEHPEACAGLSKDPLSPGPRGDSHRADASRVNENEVQRLTQQPRETQELLGLQSGLLLCPKAVL